MSAKVWNGSAWVAAKAVPVWNGSSWVGAKSIKVWTGSAWTWAWPPSTVTVSGNQTVMSTASPNPTGQNFIATNTYTATLSEPSAVRKVEWRLYSGGAWGGVRQTDNFPAGNVTHAIQFNTAAQAARIRADVTMMDGTVISSNELTINVYTKTLYATVNDNGQIGGNPAIFTASCGADCPSVQISAAWYWWNGSAMIYHTTGNPGYWYNPDRNVDFYYRENFPDGSYLYSTVAAVRPTSAEYILNGGHCHDINAAMIAARQQGKPLRLTGTFYCYTTVDIVDGLEIRAQGAMFYVNKQPGGAYDAGRFRNGVKWPGTGPLPDSVGAYNGGGFTWYGGTFDGNGDGIWTISHSPGFTVDGATFYNWASDTNDGHAIEINSSGGNNDLAGTGWRVNVLNCRFAGLPNGQRTNSNDEALQYDWAWQGSGCHGAEDHTMCHNIRVAGCTFDRLSAWTSVNGGYALCAVGGHRMSSASYGDMGNAGIANPANGEPSQRHNWLLVENNTIYNAVGASSGVSPDKGAVALWNVRDVIIRNNAFHNCTDSRIVSAWDANTNRNLNDATMNISISGNTHNGVAKTISMPSNSHTTGG